MLLREYQTPVPPPSVAELRGRIAIREEYAAELNAAGLYRDAARQWGQAEMYRRMADEMGAL
jgi:hypothetical protein